MTKVKNSVVWLFCYSYSDYLPDIGDEMYLGTESICIFVRPHAFVAAIWRAEE